jgi:hypothetical protein
MCIVAIQRWNAAIDLHTCTDAERACLLVNLENEHCTECITTSFGMHPSACLQDKHLQLLVSFLHRLAASLALPDMIVAAERLQLVAVKQEEATSCMHRTCLLQMFCQRIATTRVHCLPLGSPKAGSDDITLLKCESVHARAW